MLRQWQPSAEPSSVQAACTAAQVRKRPAASGSGRHHPGLYFVRCVDPKYAGKEEPTFFAKLFSSDKDAAKPQRYRVLIKANGAKSQVTVLNNLGVPDDSRLRRYAARLLYELGRRPHGVRRAVAPDLPTAEHLKTSRRAELPLSGSSVLRLEHDAGQLTACDLL